MISNGQNRVKTTAKFIFTHSFTYMQQATRVRGWAKMLKINENHLYFDENKRLDLFTICLCAPGCYLGRCNTQQVCGRAITKQKALITSNNDTTDTATQTKSNIPEKWPTWSVNRIAMRSYASRALTTTNMRRTLQWPLTCLAFHLCASRARSYTFPVQLHTHARTQAACPYGHTPCMLAYKRTHNESPLIRTHFCSFLIPTMFTQRDHCIFNVGK